MFREFEKVIYNNMVSVFDFVANSCGNLMELLGFNFISDLYGSNWINLSYGATAISEKILYVYNTVIFVETGLLIAILWLMLWTFINFQDKNFNSGKTAGKYNVMYSLHKNKVYFTSKVVEFLWTLLPIVVLLYIGYPSLVLLYLIEERIHPEVIVKVVGHQWYWSYENDCGHTYFVDFNTQVDTVFELYDYVRFGFKFGEGFATFFPLQTFYSYKLGDKLQVLESAQEWSGFINHHVLDSTFRYIWVGLLTVDKDTLIDYCKATFRYNFLVDFNAVENSSEYFAGDVLSNLSDLEVCSAPIRGFKEISKDASYSVLNAGVDKMFVPFSYKYLWLDVDFYSDYFRTIRHETGVNTEIYPRAYFDREFYDSYLIKGYDELFPGEKRLLEVDNRLYLPARTHIQLLVTSADVIHSFAVPAFGLKIDAIPGRLNQCFIFAKYEGTFFGQCSELCGIDHGYMPIVIEMVSYSYYSWSIRTLWGHHDLVYYGSDWSSLVSI